MYLWTKEELAVAALGKCKKTFSTNENISRKFSYEILVRAVRAYYPETTYKIYMLPDHVSWFDYTLKVVRDASVNEVVLITVV
jgi:hypothetical protein